MICLSKHSMGRHTFGVHLRMLSEAILHGLEFLDAVGALGLFPREHEAREGVSKLRTARPVRHPAQTWAVPVDFARLGIEGAAAVVRGLGRL